jgi:hypothetical protein
MKLLTTQLASATALALVMLLPVQRATAATTTFSFTGLLADGPLASTPFSGSFSFDPAGLVPGSDAEFSLSAFTMLLAGQTYTLATADATPKAVYAAGSFAGLAYTDADSANPGLRPWIAFIPGFDSFAGAYLAYTSALVGGADSGYGSYSVAVVPEPSSTALLLAGLGLIGLAGAKARSVKRG